jgi:hypothetical protein
MNDNTILNEYFIWEEKSLTEHRTNYENNVNSEINVITNDTKIDSTPKDWRDITDPKLRKQLKCKAYREANKDKIKKWYDVNKRKVQNDGKIYYELNKDKIKLRGKIYREKNVEKIRERQKAWRESNKDKIKIKKTLYARHKLKTDVNFKFKLNLRNRLRIALKKNYKSGSAVKDLGCTVTEFKSYLESKFQTGMTWDNYGLYGWHIDHIKPLASFDLTDRKQMLEACHYTNLQPLWAKDNLSKNDRLI